MPRLIKVHLKDFNASKLSEELSGIPVRVSFAGFVPSLPGSDRLIFTPASQRREVERRFDGKGLTVVEADPGEMYFDSDRELTAEEIVQLDAILSSHDSANLTAEQVRQDQDRTDLEELRRMYDVGVAPPALRLAVRLILRTQRNAEPI